MSNIIHTGIDLPKHTRNDIKRYFKWILPTIFVGVVITLFIIYLLSDHNTIGIITIHYITDNGKPVDLDVNLKDNFKFDLPDLKYKHNIIIDGFIKPRYSENYTFTIPNVYNSTSLTIDNQLIMDVNKDKAISPNSINLIKDKWVPIKIEQKIEDLNPNHLEFELNWKSDTEQKKTIPTTLISK